MKQTVIAGENDTAYQQKVFSLFNFEGLKNSGTISIVGPYRDTMFKAELNMNGTVYFNGKEYDSLSSAHHAAIQKTETPYTGWQFWGIVYEGDHGEYIRFLDDILRDFN